MSEDLVLELQNISFSYNYNRDILSLANASFNKGSINGIVGLSGSGKTTLIRLINGSIIKDGVYDYSGDIYVLSENIKDHSELNRYIGTLYQDIDNQIIFTNVVDEAVFGMENYNKSVEYMDSKLHEVFELLGIDYLKLRDPNQLSGGEKQLVVLASILTLDVEILILDECMTGVSVESRKKVLQVINKLKNQGKCIIMVEHDFENLVDASKIYEIDNGKLSLIDYKELVKG